jgi:tRNA nucleotidyltransferase (CCA-adding enzyme)
MKSYLVGGSVRDQLLGLPVTDHDHVVVGATPQEMIAAGFRPVGADFPVFLHPETHEEYALARTERKTAPGYKGFVFHTSPDVTLEEDLQRRDLTINAMALDENGQLVDPCGGAADLEKRVLRHVSAAFEEDPVRILRVARFAARFAEQGFRVADETHALMKRMVEAGEADHLVPERVWQELARGLMERHPSRMFEVLRECGALARIAPEIERLFSVPQSATSHPEIDTGVHTMMVLDTAAARAASLPVRFAALVHDLGKAETPAQFLPRHPQHEERSATLAESLCERIRAPSDVRDLARITARWHGAAHRALRLSADEMLTLLDGTDALRRPARFAEFVEVCTCDHLGRQGFGDSPYPQRDLLVAALARLQSLDYGAIAKQALVVPVTTPETIPEAIRRAKLAELTLFIEERKNP